MVKEIVKCTNIYMAKIRNTGERDCWDKDTTEIYAYTGLLYMAGVQKAQYVKTKELWDTSILYICTCLRDYINIPQSI